MRTKICVVPEPRPPAFTLALNQMERPAAIGVPLKFELIELDATHRASLRKAEAHHLAQPGCDFRSRRGGCLLDLLMESGIDVEVEMTHRPW